MNIQLQTIGIIAQDMGKTINFYRTLGLSIPQDAEENSNFDFAMETGLILGFLSESTAKDADPHFKMPSGQSMNLQFKVETPGEVDEVYQNLIYAGYAGYAEPWDAFWGQRFARIADPDGRIVNIYAHL